MISIEIIKELLNIKTNNTSNDRFLKIMRCNNPIKINYIFHLKEIKKYFNLSDTDFEENIIYSVYKYNVDLNYSLKNNNLIKENDIELNLTTIKLAIDEIVKFYNILNLNNIPYKINAILNYKLEYYIYVLKFCNILNIYENTNYSKIYHRIFNLKSNCNSYLKNKISINKLKNEFEIQYSFFYNYLYILNNYNLYNEDFIIYTILFDIKSNKQHI